MRRCLHMHTYLTYDSFHNILRSQIFFEALQVQLLKHIRYMQDRLAAWPSRFRLQTEPTSLPVQKVSLL